MEHQLATNSQAILAFLEALELSTKVSSLAQLVDGAVLFESLLIIKEFSIGEQKICASQEWSRCLFNIKALLKHLKHFYQGKFEKRLDLGHIDLVAICRNKNEEEICKLFFLVLGVLVQSSSKQFFINKILSLPSHFQACFVEKLQNSLSLVDQSGEGSERRSNQQVLLQAINQLQHQNRVLETEVLRLVDENSVFSREIDHLKAKQTAHNSEVEKWKEIGDELEKERELSVGRRESAMVIESLKERINLLTRLHEKEIKKYKEEAEAVAERISEAIQLQSLVQTYRLNYEEAVEHLKEVGDWEKERTTINKELNRQKKLLSQHEQSTSELNVKICSLQEEIIELQITCQRLNTRNTELALMSRPGKSLHLSTLLNTKTQGSTLSDLIPEMSQQNITQDLKREGERKGRRISLLQKQVQKLKFKAGRLTQLQKEKARLQSIIMQQSHSKGDEVELLTSCLYELRMRVVGLQLEKEKV